jgi:hypothetical protein
LDLKDVPLAEALKYVVELSGMQLVYESYAITVKPLGEPPGAEMLVRVFKVNTAIMGRETDQKEWLASHGIAMQEGSYAVLENRTSRLIVKAGEPVLTKIEALLVKLNVKAQDQPAKPQSELMQRATKIIIPKMVFADATLTESVEFLREKSKQLDPEKKGVNIVLMPGAGKSDAKITLSLTNVPLTEALRYVTELAGVRFEVSESAFQIMSLEQSQVATALAAIDFKSDKIVVDPATGITTYTGGVKATFGDNSFEAGEVRYDPKAGTLEVTKTFKIRHNGSGLSTDNPTTRAVLDLKTQKLKVFGPVRTTIAK